MTIAKHHKEMSCKAMTKEVKGMKKEEKKEHKKDTKPKKHHKK